MRKHAVIGFLISGVCLYFAFRGLALKNIARAVAQADPAWVIAAMGVYSGSYLMRALRWKGLLAPIKRVSAVQLLRPLILGFFSNNIFPLRMGELVRAHVCGLKFGISRVASLGTIVVERVFDSLSFLTIFLIIANFFSFPPTIQHAARAFGVACGGLIVVLWFSLTHQSHAQALIERAPLPTRWRVKTQELFQNFVQGLSGIRHGVYVIQGLGLSLIIWALEGTTIYLIMRAFPIGVEYPQAFFLLFVLGLSVAIPQGPGYVGTVELFGTTALALIGIPREQGLPVIVTIHGAQFCFVLVLGFYALWKERMSFKTLINPSD